jgi:serine/threonine protein kinase
MSNLVGHSIDRYHILEQLGEGGMAVVYKAYDTRLESEVAVKIIRTDNLAPNVLARALKRFEREAKALAKLTHANIVKVLDYGEYDGKPYLVMPFLPGGTLKELLKGKPMSYRDAGTFLIPIARALAFAHQEGMVHRDVKPSNILVTRSGDPMLTDFGIAKIIDEEGTQDLTGTSAAVGTPEYMAPEQITSKSVDHRADIYALGIVYYEMVTGRKPFQADTPLAVLVKHASEPLPRPKSLVPSLPDSVEHFLIKALAKNPAHRYQSMNELLIALEGVTKSETTRQTISAGEKKHPLMNRLNLHKLSFKAWWGYVGILILLLTGLGWYFFAYGFPNNLLSSETANTPISSSALTPTAELLAGSTAISPKDGMVMALIPDGFFTMGSDSGAFDERPEIKNLKIDSFWIDLTEVTNAMYVKCVHAGACQPPSKNSSYTRTSYYGNSQYDNFPVIYVSWDDANSYCSWADRRLPTEAEWERAARGNDKRDYPWGNQQPNSKLGNFDTAVGDTTAVGSYPDGKSFYGTLDMAGNVWEWVSDYYDPDYYAKSVALRNPTGPSDGEQRIIRGGAWNSAYLLVKAINRNALSPTVQNYVAGFRCVTSSP